MKRTVILGSLAFLMLCCVFLGRCYSQMLREENTQEVWRNLSFITYSEAKIHIQKEGVDVNSRGTDGKTFLMVASEMGLLDTAQIMIDLGADINAKDDKGETALQLARLSKNREIIGLLLKHGAR